MKTFRFIIISLVWLFSLQLIGYQIVGKRAIHIVCMEGLNSLAFRADSVGIYSPYCQLTSNEKLEIKKSLGAKYNVIEFIENEKEFVEKFRLNKNKYGMSYQVEKLNFLMATTNESNGTLYYGEDWKSEYIWFLFRWIKISQENCGQS